MSLYRAARLASRPRLTEEMAVMDFNDGHHCEFPDAAPGDHWECSVCHWQWMADEAGPLDITWRVVT